MGGKQKQAQRTKGNAKASSSARAAEFVQGSGGFLGFGAMGGDLGYVPVTGADDLDVSVDADFRMLLKKVTKKDTATKLKALGEISAMCEEKDADSVKTVLPFWPRIYNKLAIDSERRVREASHKTFHSIIQKVGRDLAPHLKALIGPWLVSQCDTYAPASSAAKSAFLSAFPPAKQSSVIAFCKKEIFKHIEDNLFTQQPQTLSDPKTTDAVDMQSKYERVLAGSLGAWRLLLTLTAPQPDMIDSYKEVLAKPAFWKLQKHQAEVIRSAFYQLVSALCESNPTEVNEYREKFCTTVFYSVDESSPVVCPALWEAMLHVAATVKDWWSVINARKGMLPKLWKLLRTGGEGSAVAIYPNLLPLLSTMPAEETYANQMFVDEFNNATIQGLTNEKVLMSSRDVASIMRAFIECNRFFSSNQTGITKETNALILSCIDKIFHVLEACLAEKNEALHQSPFYSLFANLVKYCASKNEMEAIRKELWRRLDELLIGKIRDETGTNSNVPMLRMMKLFDALLKKTSSYKEQSSQNLKVKFATETDEVTHPPKQKEERVDLSNDQPEHKLLAHICQVLAEECSKRTKANSHIQLLCHLLCMVGHNPGILSVTSSSEVSRAQEVMTYIEKDFLKLIGQGADDLVLECSVYLVCSVEDDLIATCMESILKILENRAHHILMVIRTCILLSSDNSALKAWLAGDMFGTHIVQATKQLCFLAYQTVPFDEKLDTEIKRNSLLNIVTTALTGSNGDSVVNPTYIEQIVPELIAVIPKSEEIANSDDGKLENAVFFVCELAASLFPAFKENVIKPASVQLITELLKLSCHWPAEGKMGFKQGQGRKRRDLRPLVDKAWQAGARSLVCNAHAQCMQVLRALAAILQQAVSHEQLTWDKLSDLSAVGKGLIMCTEGQEPECTLLHQALHLHVAPRCKHKSEEFINIALPPSVVNHGESKRTCHSSGAVFTDTEIIIDLAPLCFNINLDTYRFMDGCKVTDLCQGIAYCSAVNERKHVTSGVHNVKGIKSTFEFELSRAVSNLDKENVLATYQTMLDNSLKYGGLQALTLKAFVDAAKVKLWEAEFINTVSNNTEKFHSLSEGSAHTLLACISCLTQAEQDSLISALVDYMHNCDFSTPAAVLGCTYHLAVLSELLAAQPCNFQADSDSFIVASTLITYMQQWPHLEDNFFLFESEVTEKERERVMLLVQVMNFLRVMVEKSPTQLTSEHWDFVQCSMLSWVHSCKKSEAYLHSDVITQIFAIQTFNLVHHVASRIQGITPEVAEQYPGKISSEWQEFFSQGAYTVLLPLFVNTAAKKSDGATSNPYENLLITSLAMATCHCPLEHLLSHSLPAKLDADDKSGMSDSLQTILNHLCPLLIQNQRAVQYCAFLLLKRLMPEVWKTEASGSEEDEKRQPPSALWNITDLCQEAMTTCTTEFHIGDTWVPENYSEEQAASTAYLLSWTLLIDLFTAASPPVRAAYASFLRESNVLSTLMFVLFTLMPENPVVEMKDKLTAQSPSAKLSSSRNLFAGKPKYDCHGTCAKHEVGALACHVYYKVLQHLPALARQWWNDQDRRVAELVDRFTSKYASPILCEEQISEVSKNLFSESHMTVKTRPITREVIAIYGVDEASLELVISLAENHPLGPLKVESGKKTGIANTQWRNWMLQLTTFLLHQNGSLADGLVLWKRNVDKRFEGVEECLICFSVIHGSTCHLPRLQCKTCKKKFHSACLYKWFSTSNNSSCPNCRNLF